MDTAGLTGIQLLLQILVRMGAADVGIVGVVKARSICGAALEDWRTRLQE